MTNSWTSFGLVLSVCLAGTGCGSSHGSDGSIEKLAGVSSSEQASPVLDGREKSLVLVGYSTSYAWPVMLQEMLDEHAGGSRTYHVLNAVIGGSPVGRWIADPSSDDYQDTYGAMCSDFFGSEARLRGDSIDEHSGAFTEDRLHPNQRGGKIVAEAWYRALAGDGAQSGIIEAMHAREYDVDALITDYLAWRAAEGND